MLSESDVDRILTSVDRSTALGRRNYAILLLAARYGLCPCDIRQLTLDEIDWRGARIDIRQVKTGRPLALPLLPEVADALSAYLRDGRPASTNRIIFLRHCAPFEPFAIENNLAAIMRAPLRRAGLTDRKGYRGLYLFRHTLATRLLAFGRHLKTIADTLGHASTQTTYGYTRADLVGLRGVAISEEEVARFLALKHAMGYCYQGEGRALHDLDCFLNTRLSADSAMITPAMVHDYVARWGTESETTREHRLTLIREVCRFLRLDDASVIVPDRRSLRIVRSKFVPRVLSRDEGRRFLQACSELSPGQTSSIRAIVLGTALRVLHLVGLRAGELLRLTQADVDHDAGTLHIRHTKFDKSRVLPLAPDLVTRLRHCRTRTIKHFGTYFPQAPFFVSPRSGQYSAVALRNAFHQVLRTAGIERTSHSRIRLHDLSQQQQNRVVTATHRRPPIDGGRQLTHSFGRNGARCGVLRPVGDRRNRSGKVTGDAPTIACVVQEGSQRCRQEFGALHLQAGGRVPDKSHNVACPKARQPYRLVAEPIGEKAADEGQVVNDSCFRQDALVA